MPIVQVIFAQFLKPLGDGAMIVRIIERDLDATSANSLLLKILDLIRSTNEAFQESCTRFAQSIGHHTELRLGWGIVRGSVQKLESPEDYVGPNVNKCARLCGEARPFGIIVDSDDFPTFPKASDFKFFPQLRKLKGVAEEVSVWVTEEIATQFLTREQYKAEPEVHVAGQCIDTSNKRGLRILIARRAPWRVLYPELYEGCGGQLAASEDFKDGVVRHYQMEMKLPVKVFENIHCFYRIIKSNEKLIPGIRFLCERLGEEEPSSNNHTDIRWVSESAFKSMPADQFIPGLKDEVLQLIARYKQSNPSADS